MDKRILTIGMLALLTSAVLPATAYHIDGMPAGSAGPSAVTSADWVLDNSALILCESNGQNDDRVPAAEPRAGIGGLCTTGRNDATGAQEPSSMPGPNNWTRLDVCTATTTDRNNEYPSWQNNACDGGPIGIGRTDTVGWSAEIGAFECFVPTTGSTLDLALGTLSSRDYALYYEELYAWWSYDGNGTYDANDAPGTLQNGGNTVAPFDTDPLDPTAPGFDPSNHDAYRGHVSMFPDPSERSVGAATSVVGSAEAHALTASEITQLLSNVDDLSDDGTFSNECGASPSLTDDGNQGPVIVAPSDPTIEASRIYVLPGTAVLEGETGSLFDGIALDEGVVACSSLTGFDAGGACLPFSSQASGTISVEDLAIGTDVAFQVCVDHNQDNECTPGLTGSCREVWYSHPIAGAPALEANPMEGLPTSLTAGCPGAATTLPPGLVAGAWDGYVVFMCAGAHDDGAVHAHAATIGVATMSGDSPAALDNAYDEVGGFCGPPPGLPVVKTYVTI